MTAGAPTFSGQFLGCKVSQTDLATLRERLAADGLHEVHAGGHVHVVNGCAVTSEAVAKTRQAIRRALADGSAHVVVTGCAARLAGARLADLGDRVHVVAQPAEAVPAAVGDLLARPRLPRTAAGAAGPRPDARLREGAGRLLVQLQLLRDPAGARSEPLARARRRARRGAPPRRRRALRDGADRRQRRPLPRQAASAWPT